MIQLLITLTEKQVELDEELHDLVVTQIEYVPQAHHATEWEEKYAENLHHFILQNIGYAMKGEAHGKQEESPGEG